MSEETVKQVPAEGPKDSRSHVVVIGAGIAGLHVAQRLVKRKEIRVTLVSPNECFVFLPRLTELFSKSIPESKACVMVKDVWRGDHVGERATIINPQEKQVVLESGKQLTYDVLVVATGSVVNFFNTPGSEYCYPFYSENDMDRLHDHVLGLLEADEQPGTRTFAVVGGGPTGCEVAYALSKVLESHKATGKIIVLDRGPSVLASFPQSLREAVTDVLNKRNITIMPNTGVVSVTPLSVEIQRQDGVKESMPCLTTIWAAGSKPQNIAVTGVEKTPRGELPVRPSLQLMAHDSVFVAGDLAAASCPKTAQAAVQQAQLVADNVVQYIRGKTPTPFVFKEKGTIIALEGDTAGLFFGKLVRGFIAQQVRDKYYKFQLSSYS